MVITSRSALYYLIKIFYPEIAFVHSSIMQFFFIHLTSGKLSCKINEKALKHFLYTWFSCTVLLKWSCRMHLLGPESLTEGGRILCTFFWNYGTIVYCPWTELKDGTNGRVVIGTTTYWHRVGPYWYNLLFWSISHYISHGRTHSG